MTAIQYLQKIAQEPCTTRTLVAQGILWAEASCRIDGTMAMALRSAEPECGARLLDMAVEAGCDTMADAGRWLNESRDLVLEVLG